MQLTEVPEVQWHRLGTGPEAPPPRCSHTATAIGSPTQVYIIGGGFVTAGRRGFTHLDDVWRFDSTTTRWSRVTPTLRDWKKFLYPEASPNPNPEPDPNTNPKHNPNPEPLNADGIATGLPGAPRVKSFVARRGHTAVAYRDRFIIVFGGDASSTGSEGEDYVNDVWALDTAPGSGAAASWTLPVCDGTAPLPRRGHYATLSGSNMVVCGGFVDSNPTPGYPGLLQTAEATPLERYVRASLLHRDLFVMHVLDLSALDGASRNPNPNPNPNLKRRPPAPPLTWSAVSLDPAIPLVELSSFAFRNPNPTPSGTPPHDATAADAERRRDTHRLALHHQEYLLPRLVAMAQGLDANWQTTALGAHVVLPFEEPEKDPCGVWITFGGSQLVRRGVDPNAGGAFYACILGGPGRDEPLRPVPRGEAQPSMSMWFSNTLRSEGDEVEGPEDAGVMRPDAFCERFCMAAAGVPVGALGGDPDPNPNPSASGGESLNPNPNPNPGLKPKPKPGLCSNAVIAFGGSTSEGQDHNDVMLVMLKSSGEDHLPSPYLYKVEPQPAASRLDSDEEQTEAPATPAPRNGATLTPIQTDNGGGILLFGGGQYPHTYFDDTWFLRVENPRSPEMEQERAPRSAAAAAPPPSLRRLCELLIAANYVDEASAVPLVDVGLHLGCEHILRRALRCLYGVAGSARFMRGESGDLERLPGWAEASELAREAIRAHMQSL